MVLSYFAHSWLSDWNHGNAHFLRGLARSFQDRGHQVRAYEAIAGPGGGWSLAHLRQEPTGAAAVAQFRARFPDLDIRLYGTPPSAALPIARDSGLPWAGDWEHELRDCDLVIVHEWNPLALLQTLLHWRRRYRFRLVLHDTHHRALSQPEVLQRLPLDQIDGVIAFGESLRRIYRQAGARRAFTLHEAADIVHFHPHPAVPARSDLLWIGNWGDDERSAELHEYLFGPARRLGLTTRIHGVRYPAAVQRHLRRDGFDFRGYLPNLDAPAAYAQTRLALHIPRRPYRNGLPGIPTIRVFEALACGMPLLCSPWDDAEQLFRAGEDYWVAQNGAEMAAHMMQLLSNPTQRTKMGQRGAATVAARHTCAHRALELEAICRDLD
ncbi:MAG TPA: glycosyltransferase [Terriglobales bacterium]|nr:glycosyltransferase [Terriglobales bacterium]